VNTKSAENAKNTENAENAENTESVENAESTENAENLKALRTLKVLRPQVSPTDTAPQDRYDSSTYFPHFPQRIHLVTLFRSCPYSGHLEFIYESA
jgi:hypothetical protein